MIEPATEALIRAALRARLPELAEAPIGQLRSRGAAYAVGPHTIVRVGDARQQASVLAAVAPRATVAVPQPLFVDGDVLAYRRIAGVPLPRAELTAHGVALGALLTRLHRTYPATVDRVIPTSGRDFDDPATCLDAAHERRRRLHESLSVAARALVDRRLAVPAPAPSPRRLLCHLDLRTEHILMHPATGELTGVLGWSAACIADPARELAIILTDMGPALCDVLVDSCRAELDPDVRERIALFARCLLLERIEQGLLADDRGAAKDALRGLQHLG